MMHCETHCRAEFAQLNPSDATLPHHPIFIRSPQRLTKTCEHSAVLILGTGGLLTILHLRRQRIEKKEDAVDFELDGDVDYHPTMGKPPASWQRNGQRAPDNPFESQPQENPFEPERR